MLEPSGVYTEKLNMPHANSAKPRTERRRGRARRLDGAAEATLQAAQCHQPEGGEVVNGPCPVRRHL